METKNKKETLSDTVSRKLEDMITTQMKAGDRLPTEMVLAEMYSVGRSTIRESLKALSSKGLIVRKKDGTFVITMDIGQINDLIELREMLEVSMIAAAVERATDEDIKNMERILWKMQNPDLQADESRELDIQLHCAFAEATGNTIIKELIKAVQLVTVKNLDYMSNVTLKRDNAVSSHSQIIEAFKNRDKEKAIETMRVHLSIFRNQEKEQ